MRLPHFSGRRRYFINPFTEWFWYSSRDFSCQGQHRKRTTQSWVPADPKSTTAVLECTAENRRPMRVLSTTLWLLCSNFYIGLVFSLLVIFSSENFIVDVNACLLIEYRVSLWRRCELVIFFTTGKNHASTKSSTKPLPPGSNLS